MAHFMFSSCPPPCENVSPADHIEPDEALPLIEDYLAKTTDEPHLHPDSRFRDGGPTLDGRTPGGCIALHQLRRIVRGLKGERLMPENLKQAEAEVGGDVDMEDVVEPSTIAFQRDLLSDAEDIRKSEAIGNKSKVAESDSGDMGEDKENGMTIIEHDMAAVTDKSFNEQMNEQGAEGIIEGEIGPRDTGVANVSKLPEVKPAAAKDKQKKQKKRKHEDDQSDARKAHKADKKTGPQHENGASSEKVEVADSQQLPSSIPNSQESHLAKKHKKKHRHGEKKLKENPQAVNGKHKMDDPDKKKKKKHKEKTAT